MSCYANGQGFKYHAFLSCAGEDKIYVKEFYNRLRQYGAKVFYYDVLEDGSYGKNPDQYLYEVLRNSQHFIFYWTSNSSNKKWINNEIDYFDTHCKNGLNREIIVYHDIIGRTDYTQLNKNLRDDYYREVNFAELLKRIGADSGTYMERRYFRLMEFLNKPKKQLDVAMKVGAGCCIWSAPVIRKIMDDGGITGADVTFFEKEEMVGIKEDMTGGKNTGISSDTAGNINTKQAVQYKHEFKTGPYFYSRANNKKQILTIPTYIKACKLNPNDLSAALRDKLQDWLPNFIALSTCKDLYDNIAKLLKEGYDKLTIYKLPNAAKETGIIFVENTVEGSYATTTPIFKIEDLPRKHFESCINKFITTISKASVEHIAREMKESVNLISYLDKKIKELAGLIDDFADDRRDAKNVVKSTVEKGKEGIHAPGQAAKDPDLQKKYKVLDDKLKKGFPVLYCVVGEVNPAQYHKILEKMKGWKSILIDIQGLILISQEVNKNQKVKNGYFFEKAFEDQENYKCLEGILKELSVRKKAKVKLYYDQDENKKLLVLDEEGEKGIKLKGGDFDSILGYISKDTIIKMKNEFQESLEFVFYDEISNAKLYTAKDVVGMVHDNKLDCVIVPGEVYEQEHEKGKNKDVLTKIASIMYTVEGGCDFRFITGNEKTYDVFCKLINASASKPEDSKSNDTQNGKSATTQGKKPETGKVLSILNELKKEIGAERTIDKIRILYTPNTVARRYHEKYFRDSKIITHEPVDFGDWKALKARIKHILKNDEPSRREEVLLVLGWQPQMGWIDEYFTKSKDYYVKQINLLDFHGMEDLPYLSYDIMLRTNMIDTWFRSYAFESFLTAIKDSIAELNKNMQNDIDREDEVIKIAKFLNMETEKCRDYLEVINFEFRYDARYFKLYEHYIRKMNSDC